MLLFPIHTHAAVFRHPDSQCFDVSLGIDMLTVAPELDHCLLGCIFSIVLGTEEVESDFQYSLAQLRGDMFKF
jgi:hypothetical protein